MKLKLLMISVVSLSLGIISVGMSSLAKAGVPGAPHPTPFAAFAQDRPWDMPPEEFREIQRQGFHDGIEGARKDFDNHRRPDVNNRDEYRHPHMPESAREDYREGFRRGYEVGVHHLYGADYQPIR